MQRVASRITSERRAKGWSYDELVRQLKDHTQRPFHKTQVHRWETGKATPSLEQLKDLADVFGRPVGWFLEPIHDADEPLEGAASMSTPHPSEAA